MISLIFRGLSKLSKLLQQYNDSAYKTFESDCNTETYTEAKEREHSRKHEQATCLPITLIDGAMINLIKTQKNTDGEYLEEMKTFK